MATRVGGSCNDANQEEALAIASVGERRPSTTLSLCTSREQVADLSIAPQKQQCAEFLGQDDGDRWSFLVLNGVRPATRAGAEGQDMLKAIKLQSVLIAVVWSISIAAHAYADPKRVDVPASDLTVVLEILAKQTGVAIVYEPKQIKGLRTAGVSDAMSPQDAVTKLLIGTPLALRADSTGAIM